MASDLMTKEGAYRIACYHRDRAQSVGVRLYWERVIDRILSNRP